MSELGLPIAALCFGVRAIWIGFDGIGSDIDGAIPNLHPLHVHA